MRINIFIDEIEFEGGGIEFNFHDQIRIKKAFERELSRLFLDTKTDSNRNFFIFDILNNNNNNNNNNNEFFSMSKNSGNIYSIKEIDGREFSLFTPDKNSFQIGKRLAKSIYSSLNLMDSGKGSSGKPTASEETINK